MQIAEGVSYIGVNDHQIDYFESQFVVPNGMAYNSYVVASDKIAVMDSVEASFGDEWLQARRHLGWSHARLPRRSPHGARP